MVPTKQEHSKPAVYLATNMVNGKIYVGSAQNFYHRYGQYRKLGGREDRPMARAIRKHGFENFTFSVLEWVDDVTMLITREQHYLDTLQPWDPIGYNVAPLAYSCLGIVHTSETRLKLSKACMGQNGRAVVQLDPVSGVFIAEYRSTGLATQATGIAGRPIHKVCCGVGVTAGGYHWCFKENYDPATYQLRQRKPRGGNAAARPVWQHDLDGQVLRMWDSPRLAAESVGLHPDSVRHVCYGKIQTAGGYRWSFVTDPVAIDASHRRQQDAWKQKHGLN
jgi:group I intron endonuclease